MCRSLSCWNGLGLNLKWKWSCHVFSLSSLFIHLLLRFKEIEPLPVCLSLSFFSLFLSLFFCLSLFDFHTLFLFHTPFLSNYCVSCFPSFGYFHNFISLCHLFLSTPPPLFSFLLYLILTLSLCPSLSASWFSYHRTAANYWKFLDLNCLNGTVYLCLFSLVFIL